MASSPTRNIQTEDLCAEKDNMGIVLPEQPGEK